LAFIKKKESTKSHAGKASDMNIFMWKYAIKVKAKDIYNMESDWQTFDVKMPKNKIATNNLLQRFLEQFPILQKIFCFLTI
jgi:hypothetical protein